MWCTRFTDSQIETLKALIRIQGEVGSDLQGALEAMELARWDELPEAELPWATVSERATQQGISEADVVWDLAGRKKEPTTALVKASARRPSKRTGKGTRRAGT